jgi:hypothetical protein
MKRTIWEWYVAGMGKTRNGYTLMIGKHAGNRPLGIRKCSWKDNIKMYFMERVWVGVK